MFLRPRRSVVPSFSAVLRLEVEAKGEERTIVLIHSAAPSPVVVPDKESPHVFFFFFFFLYSEPKSPSHRVNKEQTGDGTGHTQPTSGLGILMCPAHQMKIYRREREREREREPEREREGCAT